MRRLIRIRTMALMEVLGSGSRCSPDPRRNTSKTFFEAFGSHNKAATCCSFVVVLKRLADTLLQLCCSFGLKLQNIERFNPRPICELLWLVNPISRP